MTAATKEFSGGAVVGPALSTHSPTIASNTRIFRGTMVGLNASGLAIPAGPSAVSVLGRAFRTVNNLTASKEPNARTIVDTEIGTFQYENAGDIVAANIGRPCYALDDKTVSLSPDGGLPLAGIIHDVQSAGERAGVWVRIFPETTAPGIREARLEVGFADFAAVAATSTSIAIDTLPPGAFVLGAAIDLTTPFSGGAVSAMTVDVGPAGDTDAIIDGANLFAAAVDGKASSTPAGIAPRGDFGGDTLSALFLATGANLSVLTAGAAVIRIAYVIL